MKKSSKRKIGDTNGPNKKHKLKPGELAMLHKGLKNKKDITVDTLLKNGVGVLEKDEEGFSALYYAVQSNDRKIIQKVLDKGVSVDDLQGPNWNSQTALNYAIKDGLSTSVDFLLDKRANVNLKDPSNYCFTPFFEAIIAGKVTWVKRMLKQGGDANDENNKGGMPLEVAVREGHTQIARTLLDHGATFRTKSKTRSLLHVAVHKSAAMVKLLLNRGWGNVDIEDNYGITPIFEALFYRRMEEAVALLEAGANVKHVDRTLMKRSALHVTRSAEVVKILVRRGADLNAKDSNGNSPLLKWAIDKREDLVEPLIRAGSDVDEENNAGVSFRNLCRTLGPENVMHKVASKFISL